MNGKYFAHPYTWILLDASVSDIDKLKNLRFWMDSNIIVASYDDKQEQYDIQQIYKREQAPQLVTVEHFGHWSRHERLQDERQTRILSRRRRNLMGMNFNTSMVILNNDTLNHLNDFL